MRLSTGLLSAEQLLQHASKPAASAHYHHLSCASLTSTLAADALFPHPQVQKKTFAEEVNNAFREAAAGPMKGILAITDEPLVSVDFRCSDVSSTIDASLTMVMGDDMVKVVAWYDNEWGYSQRVVDLAEICAQKWEH